MTESTQARRTGNVLVTGLSARYRVNFMSRCETVDLKSGEILSEENQPLTQVYFPLRAFVSLVSKVNGHPGLEIGLVGSEGVLGATLALNIDSSPTTAVVQGAGSALKMRAGAFKQEVSKNPAFRVSIERYLFLSIIQLARSSACARFHTLAPRLARWLLMAHDRAHADHFQLTHEYVAAMLGVRRSGITLAAIELKRRKLIRYSRGEIEVIDRRGLEAAACECYGDRNRDYARIFS